SSWVRWISRSMTAGSLFTFEVLSVMVVLRVQGAACDVRRALKGALRTFRREVRRAHFPRRAAIKQVGERQGSNSYDEGAETEIVDRVSEQIGKAHQDNAQASDCHHRCTRYSSDSCLDIRRGFTD